MDLDRIIKEEIDRYLMEDMFNEKGPAKKEKDIVKGGKKLKGGRRGDFNAKLDRETNPNINNQDAKELTTLLKSPYVNVAAVAKDVYPDHTSQGAQSQLRKKVEGEKSDSGSTYKIKKKEANAIRRAISKNLK